MLDSHKLEHVYDERISNPTKYCNLFFQSYKIDFSEVHVPILTDSSSRTIENHQLRVGGPTTIRFPSLKMPKTILLKEVNSAKLKHKILQNFLNLKWNIWHRNLRRWKENKASAPYQGQLRMPKQDLMEAGCKHGTELQLIVHQQRVTSDFHSLGNPWPRPLQGWKKSSLNWGAWDEQNVDRQVINPSNFHRKPTTPPTLVNWPRAIVIVISQPLTTRAFTHTHKKPPFPTTFD